MNPTTLTFKDTEGTEHILNWLHFIEAKRGVETQTGSGRFNTATVITSASQISVTDEIYLSIQRGISKVTTAV